MYDYSSESVLGAVVSNCEHLINSTSSIGTTVAHSNRSHDSNNSIMISLSAQPDVTSTIVPILVDSIDKIHLAQNLFYLPLCILLLVAVLGNVMVILSVIVEKKLRSMATNHFIASLALSDLLVGALVMPFAVYTKINNNKWHLGDVWCRFHLSTTVFATTASIINLVAISIDRYFAIIFPTEYQRHSMRTRSTPYAIMVWLISAVVSMPIYLETATLEHDMCWLEDPQYMIMSSLLSFFLPATIISFLYVKIFRRIRKHLHMFWARKPRQGAMSRTSLPQVVVEEVRSRKNSRVENTSSPSRSNSPTKSASQQDLTLHMDGSTPKQRNRSPTICVSTLPTPLNIYLPVPEPPSRRVSIESGNYHGVTNNSAYLCPRRDVTTETVTCLINTPSTSYQLHPNARTTLKDLCRSPSGISTPGTASSMTSASSEDRKSSMYSYCSSLDEEYEMDNSARINNSSTQRSSVLDEIKEDGSNKLTRKATTSSLMQSSGNKLRKIAQQVTRAIRHKRRESQAIRRETRATRVVAAILIVFIICWVPYFINMVYRGACLGLKDLCRVNYEFEIQIYLITSWLGYAHSCFNCVIYTCLNKTFRTTFKRLLCYKIFWKK